MAQIAGMINRKFGKLLVIGNAEPFVRPRGDKILRYFVRCECGAEKTVHGQDLRSGNTASCGCGHIGRITHGDARGGGNRAVEYHSWWAMIQRCKDPKNISYKYYGARGIVVCDRWRNSYVNFLADMGRKPSPIHTIDRVDNNGNYEPENCKWSTPKEQGQNKRAYKKRA